MPFNSTTCPRNCPKRRQKAPKTAQCAPAPRNQERAVSWATWLKNEFRGHLVHPQPPTFYGFQAFELPNETPRPPYQWSLGAAGGPASPRTLGANGGSTGVPGAKKMIFFKVVPRPLGMLKQLLLARFEPVVARFGPRKIPKCLENGPFWDQKWLKNGSKKPLFKSDRGPFGMPKQVFLARFEPVVARFGPRKIPKCLENGPCWDHHLRLCLTLRALHHEYSSNTRMEAALKFCPWCSNDKKGQGCHSCTTTPRLCSSTTI